MNDKIILLLTSGFILCLILGIELLMPKLTRKELFFGIRIPEKAYNHPSLKDIYKKYINRTFLISVPIAVLMTIFIYITSNAFILSFGIIGILILQYVLYYLSHKKVKAIKHAEKWHTLKEEYVVIDTSYTSPNRSKLIASPWWFIVSLAIIALNVITLVSNYDVIPDRIPFHWGSNGMADQWVDKTYSSILLMPAIQLILFIIIFFAYKSIAWAKQQIKASNPEESRERNRIFRLRWSRYLFATLIILQLLFTILNLASIGLIKANTTILTILTIGGTLSIIIVAILLSIKTGQGGSRIKLKRNSFRKEEVVDRDDDQLWKLGLFYFNPDDPSLFIEKRYGVGFTINFGRPAALLVIGGIILFIILTFILPNIL